MECQFSICQKCQIFIVNGLGTFKLKKLALQREGYDPNLIDDKMFFYNKSEGAYQPLDIQLYNEVMQMRCNL